MCSLQFCCGTALHSTLSCSVQNSMQIASLYQLPATSQLVPLIAELALGSREGAGIITGNIRESL